MTSAGRPLPDGGEGARRAGEVSPQTQPALPGRPAITPGGALTTFFTRGLIHWLRRRSPATRDRLARFVASLAWTLGIRKRVSLDNLRHAFPEKTDVERAAIARGAYLNMARAALEAVTAITLTDEQLAQQVQVHDWLDLEDRLRASKGTLVASAHLGSWELFAEVMSRRGFKMSAVVRPLAGAFNAVVVEERLKAGVNLVLQRGAMKGIFAALKRGEAVVQLVDQVLPAKHGVFVPFFNRQASTTPSLSLAARRTGAPAYVVLAVREGAGLKMFVEGPVPMQTTDDVHADVTAHTAAITAIIEKYIRRYPDQWLWLHRRWKVQPPEPLS
ncbi:MAG: lysophospholipid acyltransferase family protein [Myxococcaceae bacterium]